MFIFFVPELEIRVLQTTHMMGLQPRIMFEDNKIRFTIPHENLVKFSKDKYPYFILLVTHIWKLHTEVFVCFVRQDI